MLPIFPKSFRANLIYQFGGFVDLLHETFLFFYVLFHVSDFAPRNVADPLGQLVRHGSFGVGGETPKRRLGHLVATIRLNGVHVFE